MTTIKTIVDDHKTWIETGGKEGDRATFRNKRLPDVDFGMADLRGAVFCDADLTGASFHGANLRGAHMSRANLTRACLHDACLLDVAAYNVNFTQIAAADMQAVGGNFCGANFQGAYLRGANFTESDLSLANFAKARLPHASFHDACTDGANFIDAKLNNVIGDGIRIRTLQLEPYNVVYTHTHMSIGCKTFPIDDWWKITPEEAADMSELEDAATLWESLKPILQALVTAMPAKP